MSANAVGPPQTVRIGGVDTACLSRSALAQLIVTDCLSFAARSKRSPKFMFSLNAHALSLAAIDPQYAEVLKRADIVHADGALITLASRLLTRKPIPERSATTDLIHDVAKAAVGNGVSFYLLGATEEVNATCAERLREIYPSLAFAGRRHGYFNREDESDICAQINDSGADVVWVGLGKPEEQVFCLRNRHRIGASWLITCGGCFNYITGHYRRAPVWMQNAGLEWFHRMMTNPRQLFWRYLTTNPRALYLIVTKTER